MVFRVWRTVARETSEECIVSAAVVYADLSDARPAVGVDPALLYRFTFVDALVRCAATAEVFPVLSLLSVACNWVVNALAMVFVDHTREIYICVTSALACF